MNYLGQATRSCPGCSPFNHGSLREGANESRDDQPQAGLSAVIRDSFVADASRPALGRHCYEKGIERQSAATVPKSKPGTEMRGICCPITRSIVRTIAISSGAMKV